MSDLVDRLQQVRQFLGPSSARKLSQELGVSLNSWGVWEGGKILPSASALMALAQRGIDIHWLLTGQGAMLREDAAPSVQKKDEGHGSGTGNSHWKARMRILDLLAQRHPQALSVDQLHERLEAEGAAEAEASVAKSLLYLLSLGMIRATDEGGVLMYAAMSANPGGIERSVDDKTSMLLDILHFIRSEVALVAEEDPASGIIFDGRVTVQAASEYLKAVLRFIQAEAVRLHSDSGEHVRIVLTAQKR